MFSMEADQDELIEKLLTEEDAQRRVESSGPSQEDRERMRSKLIALINGFLQRLPSEEYDFLVLYFLENVPQRSIGNLYGITQRAISYRIQRAIKRLKFLIEVAGVDDEEMRDDLNFLFRDPKATDVVCKVFEVTNLSEVQRQEGSTFFYVRSRFCDILARLKKLDPESLERLEEGLSLRVVKYVEALELVQKNFGILNSRRKTRRRFDRYYLG